MSNSGFDLPSAHLSRSQSYHLQCSMSDKNNKSGKPPQAAAKAEPGRASSELKPKKAAAHRQVIQDAAKYNQNQTDQSVSYTGGSDPSSIGGDDYEGGKVAPKRSGGKYDEDIKMVQDLDRWG